MADNEIQKRIDKYDGDISKVYNDLQEEFSRKYKKLMALFEQEKSQRQLLEAYQRRTNSVLDVLHQMESPDSEVLVDLSDTQARIDNLLQLNPHLTSLNHINSILADSPDFQVNDTLKYNLVLQEAINEIELNDLLLIEKNPQDIELWLRRNQPNLVLSRFKPITFEENRLTKAESQLDNLNNSLNSHVATAVTKKRQRKAA